MNGAQVSKDGNNYTAKWWTQGEDPVAKSCPDCVWRLVGPCGTGSPNTPPSVSLTAPSNGASATAPATITIEANATDNVSVAKVEFFNGTTKLGEDTSAPYTYSWAAVGAGTYSITARATDNQGATATSAAVSVTVANAPSTAQAIPGTIQAENYAAMSGIDTEPTTDTGGGRNVDWFETGDWVEYAVNVATAGTYTVGFRVASATGGATLQLRNSAGTSLGSVNVENTGGWQNWVTRSTTVTLPAGAQTLRVYAAASTGCNLNWISFATGNTTNPPPTVSFTAPATGATFTAPASITLRASASDANGSVSKVEFFNGTTLLGTATAAPYTYTWTGVAAGTYTLTARATDNQGATSSATVSVTVNSGGPTTSGLPSHIMSGYWHTWNGGVPFIRLRDVNAGWDVINISFAEPVVPGSTDGRMKFVISGLTVDYTTADFKADVKALQSRGKKVVLSIGGYEGFFSLGSAGAVTQFVNDIKGIVNEYGFDGIDIDTEQSSVTFNGGADPDFRNPTSPKVVNMISAIRQIVDAYPSTFILSWAPETFYFQMGRQWYGGSNGNVDTRSGVYIPMIHALRDRTTYVQAQLYNSMQMQGNDGVMYSMGTVEGIVAMTEMVIQGFTVGGGPLFPGLRPDQVVIAVPASAGAAGSGQIANAGLQEAFRRVNSKYPGLRGIMTWSINWDAYQNNNSFVTSNGAFLRSLPTFTSARSQAGTRAAAGSSTLVAESTVYPNPVLAGNRLAVDLGAQYRTVRVVLTDLAGYELAAYDLRHVRRAELVLPAYKGVALLRVEADGHITTKRISIN
ncbi:Ig-like domain-containing protein [Hymenobacter weizhouensis]|nr:Ig-like domain-containing protein [Hymenobacter sp. YIM 151500-1]UYZ64761.1 Ig-like domain-containing protein [Hymenobacter sp. YIM 151500-1]